MLSVAPSATFEAVTSAFAHSATVGVRIRTAAGADFLARTTAGVTEDLHVGTAAVFRASLTAPSEAGQFTIVWDDGTNISTEELVVGWTGATTVAPSARDLCSFADILNAVPGYDADAPQNSATNDKLQALITSESTLIPEEVGREIVGFDTDTPREFEVDVHAARWGVLPISDLSTLEDAIVKVLARTGLDLTTLDNTKIVPLYSGRRFPRNEWEPITELDLASRLAYPSLMCGQVVKITGPFGFRAIPSFINSACVNRVILRYVSDVASRGTAFADAADNLNLAAMFASARDAVAELQKPLIG